MLHKKGKVFPKGKSGLISEANLRIQIAGALSNELGGSNRAAKTVMKWAGVSERTAKNWMAGTHTPSCRNLIELMRHSDAVLEVVLCLANRRNAVATVHIGQLIAQLSGTIQDLKDLTADSKDNW